MTSAANIRANRRNALRSTGPRSSAGKTIAARNSRRHGLTSPVLDEPSFCQNEPNANIPLISAAEGFSLRHGAQHRLRHGCGQRAMRLAPVQRDASANLGRTNPTTLRVAARAVFPKQTQTE
jgi:hypothetical protein